MKRESAYYVHPEIPVDSLVGMLEVIKDGLVNSMAARQVMVKGVILGPDGRPMM